MDGVLETHTIIGFNAFTPRHTNRLTPQRGSSSPIVHGGRRLGDLAGRDVIHPRPPRSPGSSPGAPRPRPSTGTRPPTSATARRTSSSAMLSSKITSAPAAQRLAHLGQPVAFHLQLGQDRKLLPGSLHRAGDAATDGDVVVLDHHPAIQPQPVVQSAAAGHRVLLQHAQARRRLARVDQARPGCPRSRGRISPSRSRCCSGAAGCSAPRAPPSGCLAPALPPSAARSRPPPWRHRGSGCPPPDAARSGGTRRPPRRCPRHAGPPAPSCGTAPRHPDRSSIAPSGPHGRYPRASHWSIWRCTVKRSYIGRPHDIDWASSKPPASGRSSASSPGIACDRHGRQQQRHRQDRRHVAQLHRVHHHEAPGPGWTRTSRRSARPAGRARRKAAPRPAPPAGPPATGPWPAACHGGRRSARAVRR